MFRQMISPLRQVIFGPLAFFSAFLFAFSAASCAPGTALVVREVYGESAEVQDASGGQNIRPGRNFHGHPGRKSRQFQIIRTRSDWEQLWPEGYEAPKVDFSREMVLAAFAGEKEGFGYRFSFSGASASDGVFRIGLTEHIPSAGCENLTAAGIKKIRPSLILTFPRCDSRTEIAVRRQEEKTCLLPPDMEITCTVEGDEIPAFRNALPKALPALGQPVRCTASAEPGAWTRVRLEGVPQGSAAKAEKHGSGSIRFVPDLPGTYVVAAEGTRGDGFVSFRSVEAEAGIQIYDVELVEEEPEGLQGFELEIRRLDFEEDFPEDDGREAPEEGQEEIAGDDPAATAGGKSDGRYGASASENDPEGGEEDDEGEFEDKEDVCTSASPRQWCVPLSDGYSRHAIMPAAMGGYAEIRVVSDGKSPPPQGRLKVSLAGYPVFDVPLPDDGAFWSGKGEHESGNACDSLPDSAGSSASGSSPFDSPEKFRCGISRHVATLNFREARVISVKPQPGLPEASAPGTFADSGPR